MTYLRLLNSAVLIAEILAVPEQPEVGAIAVLILPAEIRAHRAVPAAVAAGINLPFP